MNLGSSLLIRVIYMFYYERKHFKLYFMEVNIMRFKEFREVEKNIEKENINKKEENYKNIKPETDMTIEEVNNFWNEIFASVRES